MLDGSGTVVANLTSKPREPTGSSEYVKEEREQLAEFALPKGAGVQRAVWNLSWDGAEMIPKGILDSGYPGVGPQALPGRYTLRLTVDGETATAPLVLRPDPRVTASSADLEAQLRFALEVRDAITRLTRDVVRLQTVRRQLAQRNELLAKDDKAKPLIEESKTLAAKLEDLEARLHNPKAEIAYDVLAQKGGTKLYSRLAPLLDWVTGGNRRADARGEGGLRRTGEEARGRRGEARRVAGPGAWRRSTSRRAGWGCPPSTCRRCSSESRRRHAQSVGASGRLERRENGIQVVQVQLLLRLRVGGRRGAALGGDAGQDVVRRELPEPPNPTA